MVEMRNGLMFGALADPDGAAEHIAKMLETKGAILEFVEPMAQLLAEAGRASAKAMGDPADYAVREWSRVIQERALEILRAETNDKNEAMRRAFTSAMQKRLAK